MVGPRGDLSSDLDELFGEFARVRVAAKARARIRDCRVGELWKAMGEARIATSVVVVRSQSLCLFERRLAFLGLGAKTVTERRVLIQQLEEWWWREAKAYRLHSKEPTLRRTARLNGRK